LNDLSNDNDNDGEGDGDGEGEGGEGGGEGEGEGEDTEDEALSAATNSWIEQQKTMQIHMLDTHAHTDTQQHTQQHTHDEAIYASHTHSSGLYNTTHTLPLSTSSLYHDQSPSPTLSSNSHSLSHSQSHPSFSHSYQQSNSLTHSHTPSSSSSSSSSNLPNTQSPDPSKDSNHNSPPLSQPYSDTSCTQQQSDYTANYDTSSSYDQNTRYNNPEEAQARSATSSHFSNLLQHDENNENNENDEIEENNEDGTECYENRTNSHDPTSLPHAKASDKDFSQDNKYSFENLESRSRIHGNNGVEKEKKIGDKNGVESGTHNKSKINSKSLNHLHDSENGRNQDKFYSDYHNTENLKMHQNNVHGSTIIITNSNYDCEVGSCSGRRMTLSDDVVDNSVEKEDEEGNSYQIQIQTEDFLKVSGLS
jgi:hypothetical protein